MIYNPFLTLSILLRTSHQIADKRIQRNLADEYFRMTYLFSAYEPNVAFLRRVYVIYEKGT